MPSRGRKSAAPLRLLAIKSWAHANEGSAIGTNVVLVGSELATFGSDALEFLLCRGVGIANVHEKTLLANANTVELSNHLVTDISVLKAIGEVSYRMRGSGTIRLGLTERSRHRGCCPCCRAKSC